MIASRRVRIAALFIVPLLLMGLSGCDEAALTPPLPTPGNTVEATITASALPSPSAAASLTHTPAATTADATTPPSPTPTGNPGGQPTSAPTSSTPVTEEPATPPSPTSGPTPTPRPDTVQIDSFTANPTVADPGGTVTLAWQTTGAYSVDIRLMAANGSSALVATSLEPTGTLDVAVGEHERNHVRYILTANYGGDPVTREVLVELTCPLAWFFGDPPPPDLCPLFAAEAGPGVAQSFEHGLMILNTATGFIHVLYDTTGEYARMYDTWTADMPGVSPDHTPPDGLYPPERGFGIIWDENAPGTGGTVGGQLGWATAPAVEFPTAFQCAAVDEPNTSNPCFVQGPEGTIYLEYYGEWRVWEGQFDADGR
jgi:hypothetical protein